MVGGAKSRYVSSTIRYSPFIWIAGASSVAYQLIAFWSFLFGGRRARGLSGLQLLLIIYCAIYAASICLAALSGAELVRLLAALYNLSIWVAGAIVFSTVRQEDQSSIRRSARLILIVLAASSVIAYFVFGGIGSVRFNSLVGYAIGGDRLPENLAANTNLYITSADWSTLGLGSRLSIMAPYPTALGMLAVVLIGLAAPERWDVAALTRFSPYVLMAILLSFLCASRATMGSMLLFTLVMFSFYAVRMSRSLNFKIFLACLSLVVGISATLILSDRALSLWESVNSARADSSSLRFELYTLSVKSALESHPLLGFGVKERISAYAIPLGSHSTIFGSMYKTGLFGLLTMGIIFSYITFSALKAGFTSSSVYRAGLGAASIAMLPLLIFEDIDSIPLVAYLFFVSLALMERPTQCAAEPD